MTQTEVPLWASSGACYYTLTYEGISKLLNEVALQTIRAYSDGIREEI